MLSPPDLDQEEGIRESLTGHDKEVGPASCHIIMSIQCCPLLARPAGNGIQDGPVYTCRQDMQVMLLYPYCAKYGQGRQMPFVCALQMGHASAKEMSKR